MENKAFGTVDVFLLLLVLGAFVGLFKVFAFAESSQKELTRAEFEARQIGLQLLSGGFQNPEFNSGLIQKNRNLASAGGAEESAFNDPILTIGREGLISRDPWGSPFSYRILQDLEGGMVVLVWSRGPNGVRNTSDQSIVFNELGRFLDVSFHSEDVGIVVRSRRIEITN